MGRFSMNDVDNYSSNTSSNSSFFVLPDDGNTAKVRFLYETADDIDGYAVHEVEVNGKRRYVNCLRNYNDPIDNCPLCAAKFRVVPKMFLKLYNEDAGECQIWERGKTYYQRIAGLAARYNPLCNEIIEIERHGKKGDKDTKYEMYPTDNSPINLDDYECSEPLGTIILDKSYEEIETFIQTGNFPSDGQQVSSARSEYNSEPVRRTPSNTNAPRRSF